MRQRLRLSERVLRVVVRDEGSLVGLLGDLREEEARNARRRTRLTYDLAVLSLAGSYVADELYRRLPSRRAARRRRDGFPRGVTSELRAAGRLLRRRPGFSFAAAGTIALGFGAAIAVLSVAYGVWLKPLPFGNPAGIVRVYEVRRADAETAAAIGAPDSTTASDTDLARRSRVSPPLLHDLRAAEWSTLTHFAALGGASADWRDDGQTRRIDLVSASRGVFDVLQLRPLAGRFFSAEPGRREIVLSEGLWKRSFGGDIEIVGRDSMSLDGTPHLIVGVVRDDLPFPDVPAEAWVASDPTEDELVEGMRGARYLDVIGRLRLDATVAGAGAELDAFVRRLAAEHPNHEGWGATAVSLREDMIRPFTGVLRVLLVGAALFLAIACSNVAALVAAQRAREGDERRLRLALGASRWSLAKHELAQMGWLAAGGGAAAVVLSAWALAPLRRWAPSDVPRIAEVGLEPVIVAGLSGLLLLAAMAAALAGSLIGSARGSVRMSGRTATTGSGGRAMLTVVQVALTTVLLIGGAALASHFRGLARVEPGFDAAGVMATAVILNEASYPQPGEQLLFFQAVVGGLEERGHKAAIATNLPVSGSNMRYGYRAGERNPEQHWGQYHAISPDYFQVLGIPVVAGRAFEDGDRADGPPVVIVNEALAAAHFDGDPVGRHMVVVGTEREIVGVVGSVRHFGPDQGAPPELYVPFAQDAGAFGQLIVRPGGESVSADAREIIGALDAAVPVFAMSPYEDFLRAWFAPLRFQLAVVSLLAAAGTLLAVVGLYALISYVVAGRTKEIGIRVALGETGGSVFAKVVARGLALAGTGLVLGVGLGLALRNIVRALGMELAADDPRVLVVVAAMVAIAATGACLIPARRASTIDPVRALRQD